jgi:hypothetical protein
MYRRQQQSKWRFVFLIGVQVRFVSVSIESAIVLRRVEKDTRMTGRNGVDSRKVPSRSIDSDGSRFSLQGAYRPYSRNYVPMANDSAWGFGVLSRGPSWY